LNPTRVVISPIFPLLSLFGIIMGSHQDVGGGFCHKFSAFLNIRIPSISHI
jgi:hypothetical protein